MPTPTPQSDSGNQNVDAGAYSAEYVKALRDEAATWRTKLREVEAQKQELETNLSRVKTHDAINKEFEKRGVKADPSWVKIDEGVAPEKAVEKFLKDYPHLAVKTEPFAHTQNPMPPTHQNTNVENTAKHELDAVRQDPIAREKLRTLYRTLLAQNSGSTNYIH